MIGRRLGQLAIRMSSGIFVSLCLATGLSAVNVSQQLPSTGALQSPETEISRFDRIRVRNTRTARPSKLLLTDYLPPIANQKSQGSCVGWSTAYYAYTYAVAKRLGLSPNQILKPDWQFSYRFIWNQGNGGQNDGMTISKAMNIIRDQGCCTLKEMPVDYTDTKEQPSTVALSRAKKYVAQSIGSIITRQKTADAETIKQYLAEMQCPIVIAIPIYWGEFPTAGVTPDYIYRRGPIEKPSGYHAVTIIGYDDSKQAFRMVNSWGDQWGDRGQLWLDESFVIKECPEAWGFVSGGPSSRFKVPASITFEKPQDNKE